MFDDFVAMATDRAVDDYAKFLKLAYSSIREEIMPENVLRRLTVADKENIAVLVNRNYDFVLGTTQDQIAQVIKDNLEDYNKMIRGIESKFKEMSADTHSRAKTIARTETQALAGKGSQNGFEEAGASSKMWVWSGIERDTHAQMDGDVVPINEMFVTPNGNALMFPGDPDGEPEEIINCGCEMVPIYED